MRKFGSSAIVIAALCLSGCVPDEGEIVTTTEGKGRKKKRDRVPAGQPSSTPAPAPAPTVTTVPVASSGYIISPTLNGAPDLVANFAVEQGLQLAWGTGQIPGKYAADEGAFRFICGGDGSLAQHDPVVFFNRPNASHLHQVWGNTAFGATTTPADLAANAATNCNATPYSLNRSSYWMPALIHEAGDAIKPDLVIVYYKRKAASSAACNPASSSFLGICKGIPSQIRFIFGWDSKQPTAPIRNAWWYCTSVGGRYKNLDEMFNAGCKAGADLIANTVGPNCWDGKHLDSPDHRSHMSYTVIDAHTGQGRCPATHPYLIPQQENKAQYRVTADMIGTRSDGSKYSRVRLASDAMLPGARPGATLHADYMESWVAAGKKIWMDHCIDKALDCSGGDLGNGKQLVGAAQPSYGWQNPNPRVSFRYGG